MHGENSHIHKDCKKKDRRKGREVLGERTRKGQHERDARGPSSMLGAPTKE